MAKRKSSHQKRQHQQQRKAQNERRQRFMVGLVVAVAVLALSAFAVFRTVTAPDVSAISEVSPANIDGPIDAPVQVVEFGDFGCPSCRAWHNLGIKEQLKAEFGDQVSITFRHFPVITRQSPQAAEAGQCAAEQGRFWDFHDYIYEQTPQNALADDQLKSYAAAIGLDTGAFNRCLDSGQFVDYVLRDQQAAVAGGARGTPTFFINGQQVSPTYDSLAAAIRQVLEHEG